ncbi:MAG: cysteine desulfurase [Candidatus Diapherotrites archaeon]|nr:cysteine desulfurase [Candidatus Diapherotrites archaeon]
MNVRQDFPILEKRINGSPIIYMDSACMALKPRQVVDAMNEYYTDFTACHGRSAHAFAQETTRRFEAARQTVAKFIGAASSEVVFTRNTTEAINIVANGLDLVGGTVVTTNLEHNSNLLPWLRLSKQGVTHKMVPVEENGALDLEKLAEAVDKNTRLVSLVHTSNVTGATIDAREAAKIAHDNDALLLLDSAQAAPHVPINAKKSGVDFLAFSGHKMLGPSGTGALYGKKALLEELDQFIVGGSTVKDVSADGWVPEEVPGRFEAGLQDYAGVLGFAAAADYLTRIGMGKVRDYEKALGARLLEGLAGIDKLTVIGGDAPERTALASFVVEGVEPHDIAMILSESHNIFLRSGMHCAHFYHKEVGLPKGTVRASLYIYSTEEEIDTFVSALSGAVNTFA